MRDALRQKVQVRDEYRCLYCGITELDIGSTLTIDHIQPKQQGGTDNVDNLLYCCHACNEFKGKYYKTAPELQLLNPLVDNFAEHYQEQDNGTLLAITERGAKHIEVLHLNRPRLVQNRLRKLYNEERDTYVAALEAELRELRQRSATE